MKSDLYQRITDRIVTDLEQGVRSWLKPWNASHMAGRITRPLRWNGKPYSGINVIGLWAESVAKGYSAPIWMTFKQALELGAHVRKGEHGSLVVFADRFTKTELDASGSETERQIPFLKAYTAFNVEQIEDLPAHYYAVAEPVLDPVQRIAHAEGFFAATKPKSAMAETALTTTWAATSCRCRRSRRSATLKVTMQRSPMNAPHWTRHPSRLERDFGRKRFGDEGYAMEELVAELGAAFLCADLSLTPEPRDDHAAYIASWLKVLKGDKRAVFTAAAHAQRAADYLGSLQALAMQAAAQRNRAPHRGAHVHGAALLQLRRT